jgi:hypothetical protein
MNSLPSQATPSRTDHVRTTGYPMVCLVDLDGFRVGPGEKDIPDIQPEPQPADSWPAWTDCIRARCGRRDFDRHALQVLFGDAMDKVLDRIDAATPDDDDIDVDAFDAALQRLEESDPTPAELPDSFPVDPSEEQDTAEFGPPPIVEPPADWRGSAAAGWAMIGAVRPGTWRPGETSPPVPSYLDHFGPPPVCGGAPEPDEPPFEPSEADWQDYRRWSEDLERRRSVARDLRPDRLAAVAEALYGPDSFA